MYVFCFEFQEMCFDDSPMTETVDNQLNHLSAPEVKLRNDIIKSKTLPNGDQAHRKIYFSIFLHVDFFSDFQIFTFKH